MGGVDAELDPEPVEVDLGGVSVLPGSVASKFCLLRVLLGTTGRTPLPLW